ncbi:ABC transporter permease subunit [Blastococcus brunescens]|uniref:ABC transporter permease subunit n=1 Tax=Blastococcus brunescens TaxID=1564165 RepID=A0ABZ1AZD7_9ACTN|nr:ABC transporter permease subunit [Blastococcus sp. BMG 8361]WRL62449.1 ABC transporter permease subunit [Blastococcus sp. BMG 8361]
MRAGAPRRRRRPERLARRSGVLGPDHRADGVQHGDLRGGRPCGVASLPRGQREAALATGLTNGQAMRIVLLPQAFRIMLPAIISQLVVVLKDTSLVTFVANYDELLSQGESIVRNLDNPIQTFTVIALLYIAINYLLGRLAQYVQRRQGRAATRVADTTDAGANVPVGGGA